MIGKPNAYMIHRIAGVLTLVGVQTTNVRHDLPAEAAEKVLEGKIAFVAADALREAGAAIMERMNGAALAHAVGAGLQFERGEMHVGELLPADAQHTIGTPRGVDAWNELREQFGPYFDAIEDVDLWCRAVRRGDDLPGATLLGEAGAASTAGGGEGAEWEGA